MLQYAQGTLQPAFLQGSLLFAAYAGVDGNPNLFQASIGEQDPTKGEGESVIHEQITPDNAGGKFKYLLACALYAGAQLKTLGRRVSFLQMLVFCTNRNIYTTEYGCDHTHKKLATVLFVFKQLLECFQSTLNVALKIL